MLLSAGCGSVEEVISRDVPRTFPEHPLFNTPAGQQKLLRVLKAYAAADPEVRVTDGDPAADQFNKLSCTDGQLCAAT